MENSYATCVCPVHWAVLNQPLYAADSLAKATVAEQMKKSKNAEDLTKQLANHIWFSCCCSQSSGDAFSIVQLRRLGICLIFLKLSHLARRALHR